MNINQWFTHAVAHATPTEFVFAIVALASVVMSVHSLRDALLDSAVLSAARVNGPRRLIANNNIRQEQLRLAIAVVMMLAGVTFLFLEPPPPEYINIPQSLVGLIAWIFVALLVMFSSYVDKSVRQTLQKYAPLQVEIESVTIEAPISPSGEPSLTPEADVIKIATETRAEAAAEKAENAEKAGENTKRRAGDPKRRRTDPA